MPAPDKWHYRIGEVIAIQMSKLENEVADLVHLKIANANNFMMDMYSKLWDYYLHLPYYKPDDWRKLQDKKSNFLMIVIYQRSYIGLGRHKEYSPYARNYWSMAMIQTCKGGKWIPVPFMSVNICLNTTAYKLRFGMIFIAMLLALFCNVQSLDTNFLTCQTKPYIFVKNYSI